MEIIDYIKSGEFTFCSRCGHICHLGKKDFICRKCISDLFPRGKMLELKIKEKYLFIEIERKISDILTDYRKRLAGLRGYIKSSLTS